MSKRVLFVTLLLVFAGAVRAEPTDRLLRQLNEQGSLEPLFAALSTEALAQSAGLDQRLESLLAEIKPQLRGGKLRSAALAEEAAGETLRLDFAGRNLNYLMLERDAQGRLAGWYDFALGVRLIDLVQALVERGESARDYLKLLERNPVRALGTLPDSRAGRVLSRLALAACGGGDCYAGVLARMEALDPVRASLWRYERAVQTGSEDKADLALADLREELGRDPGLAWLEYARALARGRCEAVRADLESAVERWPAYRRLYPLAAQCAARTRDWPATTRWLRALEKRFGETLDDDALRNHPVYGDYVESDSYRAWRDESTE